MQKLTDREQTFYFTFLANNGCGAKTFGDLLVDNFSCQEFKNLIECMPELSKNQIKGFLASLQEKGYIVSNEMYDLVHKKIKGRLQLVEVAYTIYEADEEGLKQFPVDQKFA